MSALHLAVFAPFGAALLAPFVGRLLGARAGYLLALSFLPALSLVRDAERVRGGDALAANLPWVPTIGLNLTLRADGFSLLFALLVAGIGVLILSYAAAYLGAKERHGRFYSYLLLFGGAMLGLVLADNLIALFAFWELTSVSSFLLIGFWDARRASVDGALKALIITSVGGLALLAATILASIGGGSFTLSGLDAQALRSSPLFVPALSLFVFAAFTKSAQIPFHLWLPTAMEAPTPVSAYLHSATMVKAGVVLIAKLGFLFEASVFAPVIMYVGLLTMFWGSYLALRQTDLKALLAYSTVSQLGILMSLYGAGHPFAATAHLVNHAAFKAALFMVVGIIDHETKSRDITKLSGLRRKLPITFLLALPAALSMAGLPLLGGFISKELFYEEMLHAGALPMIIAVTGSVMTFAYSLKFLSVFFGPFRSENPKVHEASVPFWLPAAPLSVATILFGLVPLEFGSNPLTSATLATWLTNLAAPGLGYEPESLYTWHGLTAETGPVLALSALTWLAGAGLFAIRGRFNKVQGSLTPGWNVNTIYYAFLDGLELFANRFTRFTQGASFAIHLRLIFGAAALVGASALWRYVPPSVSAVPFAFWAVTAMILVGTLGVLLARSRLNAVIFAGLAGLGSTLAFILLSAPDLALTQLLIETVTIILFLSVFRFLPRMNRYSRTPSATVIDVLLSLGVSATMFTTLVAVQTPVAPRIKDYFLDFSKELGGGYNVVNVILVDFRGYDTMGEITVLAVVAVSVYALLRLGVPAKPPTKVPDPPPSLPAEPVSEEVSS